MFKKRRHCFVVFDFDGTLVDSSDNICAVMVEAFTSRGHKPPKYGAIRHTVGLPLENSIASLAPGLPDEEVAELRRAYRDFYSLHRQREDFEEPLFPGAARALDTLLNAGYSLGIATGKSMRGLEFSLARHKIAGYFISLETPEGGRGKPHPDMLERGMASAGVGPSDTILVGDTSFDMAMAETAGAYGVGVGWGYHPASELMAAGAETVIESFTELLPLADFMMGGRED